MSGAGPPPLSVVLRARSAKGLEEALGRLAALGAAPSGTQVVVGWQGDGPPPGGTGADEVLHLFPLSASYAWNRGMAAARAPVVAFLDDGAGTDPGWVPAALTVLEGPAAPAAVVGPPGDRSVAGIAARREFLARAGGLDVVVEGPRTGGLGDGVGTLLRIAAGGGRVRWLAPAAGADPRPAFRRGLSVGGAWRRGRAHRGALAVLRAAAARPSGALPAALGFLAGAAARPRSASPLALLELCPRGLADRLQGVPVRAMPSSAAAKTHFMYRAGDAVLHLYVNPSQKLGRGLREREAIRREAGVAGIPALRASERRPDAVWVLEDHVPGAAPPAVRAVEWFPRVADWLVAMGGPPGPPLGEDPAWREHAQAAVAAAPPEVAGAVEEAMRQVARLPAAHMHGDCHRRNLRIDGPRVGLVDWEGAWLRGLPGLDIVYLALLLGGDRPDGSVILRLARGEDPPGLRMLAPLARLAVTGAALSPALLAMLATWSLAEERRLSRLGGRPQEPLFRRLLEDAAPRLS